MRRFCARPSGLSLPAIRQWVRETAQRLENELGEEFILAASDGIELRLAACIFFWSGFSYLTPAAGHPASG